MEVSQQETKRIAKLARIELEDQEVAELSVQLTQILNFVEKIKQLSIGEVERSYHPLGIQNTMRADEPVASIERQRIMSLAPQSDGQHFIVPAIIE